MLKLEIMIQFTFPCLCVPNIALGIDSRQTTTESSEIACSSEIPKLQFITPEVYDQLNRNWVVMGETLSSTHKSDMNKFRLDLQTRASGGA